MDYMLSTYLFINIFPLSHSPKLSFSTLRRDTYALYKLSSQWTSHSIIWNDVRKLQAFGRNVEITFISFNFSELCK